MKSIYVPNNSLQGDNFPAHLIWDDSINVHITVELPEGVCTKELYNVPEDGFILEHNVLEIEKFEVNGYMGLVLYTKIFSDYKVPKTIMFRIRTNDTEVVEEKEILLFRPNFVIKKIPDEIILKELDDTSVKVQNQIVINNEGLGTAIISISFDENNIHVEKIPNELDEFKLKFINDFNNGIKELKGEYPNHSKLIDAIIEINDIHNVIIDKNLIMRVEEVGNELLKILIEDNEFKIDFFERFYFAYVKNSSFLTEINLLINYLNAVAGHKTIFPEAISKLRINEKATFIRFKLGIIDFAKNDYTPINFDIPIKFEAKSQEIFIQIIQLFSFENEIIKKEVIV